jgi:hypothetical protein
MLIVNMNRSAKYQEIQSQDQILVGLIGEKNMRSLIAEYEVDQVQVQKEWITLYLEPIYIAPPNSGIIMNELVYAKLRSYESPKEWEAALEEQIIDISPDDFKELAKRLAI